MTMADPRPLTRDQLAKFLPDAEAIKRFERLFYVAGDLTPTDVATLYRLSQEALVDAGTAEAKANEALSVLNLIAGSLDLLAKQPPIQKDTFLAGDYIDFPLSGPHVTRERRLQWNPDDGTLDIGLLNEVVLQIGQETLYYAKNTSGVAIGSGQSVMATGSIGASGKLAIAPAVADGSVPARFMIGVAAQSIAQNQFGYVTSFGLVRGINTTGTPYGETWADGDVLYFNPTTPGGLTKVQPQAPKLKTPQAIVISTGVGSGSIFVRMSSGTKLEDIDDVEVSSPVDGDQLTYNATLQRWEPSAPGTMSAQNADNVNITGGTISGITDLTVADGGTGASTAIEAMKNLKGIYILASAAPDAVCPANTSENTLATITVPAGSMGPNGVLKIRTSWSVTNSANTKNLRVRFGGSPYTLIAATTIATASVETQVINRGVENSQIAGFVSNGTSPYGTSTASQPTSTVDTTAAANITITAQLANSAESIILRSYTVELLRP